MLGKPKATSQGNHAVVRDVGARYGLDRVGWIRVVSTTAGTTCELHGARHRHLVTVRISVETALALARAGVPVVSRAPQSGAGGRVA